MWLTGVGYAGCSTASDSITAQCCAEAGGLYAYYVNGTTNGCAATDTTTNLTLAGFSPDAFRACATNLSQLSICTRGPLDSAALPIKLDGKFGLAVGALLASALLVL